MRGVLEPGEVNGGPGETELSSVLKRDQEEHPGCSYSQSKSSMCRLVNGDRSCETLRKVLRVCPGRTPVEIYSASEQSSGESEVIGRGALDEGGPGFGNGVFNGGGLGDGGLFGHFGGGGGDIFSELLRPWNSFGLPYGSSEVPFPDFVPPPTTRDGGAPADENGDKKWWSRLFGSVEPPHRLGFCILKNGLL